MSKKLRLLVFETRKNFKKKYNQYNPCIILVSLKNDQSENSFMLNLNYIELEGPMRDSILCVGTEPQRIRNKYFGFLWSTKILKGNPFCLILKLFYSNQQLCTAKDKQNSVKKKITLFFCRKCHISKTCGRFRQIFMYIFQVN